MWNAQGVRDADSTRIAGSTPPPDAMPRLDPRRFHVLELVGPDERDFEMGSARRRADSQAHIRQWGVCARKWRFDVHGEVSPCLWVPYGLRPCRGTGRAAAGTPDVDGSDPRFWNAWIGIPEGWHVHAHATLPEGRSRRINPLREGYKVDCASWWSCPMQRSKGSAIESTIWLEYEIRHDHFPRVTFYGVVILRP